jgi:tetratricopeptide (TPR) repeat protein
MFISSRDAISAGEPELDAVSKKLSMNNLLDILKTADDLDTATVISDSLKEIWKAHVNSNLRWKLATATSHLLGGNTNRALSCFSELVDEDPSYAEAWNKASTCEFMLGNMEASLAAARKTLECLPTHFQAQNGLGLVYYEKKDLPSAVECFHKSMDLDPWSPVSSRLSVCLDTLKLWNSTSGNKPNES